MSINQRTPSFATASGEGGWILNPLTNNVLKVMTLKKGELTQNPKIKKQLAAGGATAKNMRERLDFGRYSTEAAAKAAGKEKRARATAARPKGQRKYARVAYFNKNAGRTIGGSKTGRIELKPKSFEGTQEDGYYFRSEGVGDDVKSQEADAKFKAATLAFDAKMRKTKPTRSKAKGSNIDPEATYYRFGGVDRNGQKSWVGIGNKKLAGYIDGFVAAGKTREEALSALVSTTGAERIAASKSKGGRKELTEAQKAARNQRLKDSRATKGSFVWCVKKPTDSRSKGVRWAAGKGGANSEKVTTSARKLAGSTGLANATQKEGGVYVISDDKVEAHLISRVKSGALVADLASDKCTANVAGARAALIAGGVSEDQLADGSF